MLDRKRSFDADLLILLLSVIVPAILATVILVSDGTGFSLAKIIVILSFLLLALFRLQSHLHHVLVLCLIYPVYIMLAGVMNPIIEGAGLTLHRPLIDGLLMRFDQAFGFDWVAFYRYVHAHEDLLALTRFSYQSLLYLGVMTTTYLALTNIGAAYAYMSRLNISLFLTNAIFILFPGHDEAYVHGIEDPVSRHHMVGLDHFYYIAPHSPLPLDLIVGMVQFPSFHTAAFVLAWHANRRTFLHYLMLLSLVPMVAGIFVWGQHFLADLFGGLATAGAAVWLHSWLHARLCRSLAPARSEAAPTAELGPAPPGPNG